MQESFVQPAYTMKLVMCEAGKSYLHIPFLTELALKQLMCLVLYGSSGILPVLT